jgi:hypothetical protein
LPTLRNLSGRIKSEGGIQKNFLATEATKLEKNSRFSA